MPEAIYALLANLSSFGWLALILAWAFLLTMLIGTVLSDEISESRFQRRYLMNQADWVADRFDYAASLIDSPVPAWYPEEEVERHRFDMALCFSDAGKARKAADGLRAEMAKPRVRALSSLTRSYLPLAEELASKVSRLQGECRSLAANRVAERALETAERRLKQLVDAVPQIQLPPLVLGTVTSDLERIGNECRSVRAMLEEKKTVGEDGLILMARATTELHDLHDLLEGFAVTMLEKRTE